MFLFCFRNFFALSFFVIQRVRFGNFRMAMLPMISWGIFFMVCNDCKCIKRLLLWMGMLSDIPSGVRKVSGDDLDKEILRVGMIAELDAVSLYEQLAAATGNEDLKKVLLDIAKEEKTHVGEFEELLKRIDGEYVEELEAGKKEVDEMLAE